MAIRPLNFAFFFPYKCRQYEKTIFKEDVKVNADMIIDGEKLGQYLQKYKVGKMEFIDALTDGDHVEENWNDEDFVMEYYKPSNGMIMASDLYKKHAVIQPIHISRFLQFIGNEDAVEFFDWEAMNIEKPRRIRNPRETVIKVLGILAERVINARKSYSI